MPTCSLLNKIRHIICIVSFLLIYSTVAGQSTFPKNDGDKAKYQVQIDINNAYISGVCIVVANQQIIKGSIINEFGISAMDFTYNPIKEKVRINHLMQKLNKWYIKKLLRKDILQVIKQLKAGNTYYENKRFQITYTFVPLTSENTEEENNINETQE